MTFLKDKKNSKNESRINTPWPTYDKGDVMIDETDVDAATRAIRSKLLFRYDKRDYESTETGRFENSLCHYFGVKHALALSSGTAALTLSLMSLGIKQGDCVGCPGFAFSATPSSILLAKAIPVLIEVDENLHMDIEDLRKKVKYLKAIVVVHMRGFASDMSRIIEIANEFGIPVVEDAVPALGVKCAKKCVGTYGVAGAFSMQSDKSLNTGEGGFILTNDTDLYSKAVIMSGAYENRYLKHFEGINNLEMSDVFYPLFNFRIDEIRSAIALNQLSKLDKRLKKSHEIYDYIHGELSKISRIVLRKPVDDDAYLGDNLLFRVSEASPEETINIAQHLNEFGIDARALGNNDENVRRYWDWRFLFPEKSLSEMREILPKTTYFLDRTIDIPLSPLD